MYANTGWSGYTGTRMFSKEFFISSSAGRRYKKLSVRTLTRSDDAMNVVREQVGNINVRLAAIQFC